MRRLGVLAVIAITALGACGDSDSSEPASSTSTSAFTSTSSAAAPSDLTALIPTADDVTRVGHETVRLATAPDATSLSVATLDVCRSDFPSESSRAARYQVSYEAGARTIIGVEAVRYRQGGATQAIAELRAAGQHCTGGALKNAEVAPTESRLLSDQFVVSGEFSQQGESIHAANAYQVRGDYLVAVYAYRSTRDQAVAAAFDVAELVKTRLTNTAQ